MSSNLAVDTILWGVIMIKIAFFITFVISFLAAQSPVNFKEDNNITKERNIFKEQSPKRIKIPTH